MVDINAVLNDATWVERSQFAADLTPRFAFLLQRPVHVGDPNSAEQLRSEVYTPPIALPALGARNPLRPTASEALDREVELAAYYRDQMEMTGRGPDADAVGYWLGLEFVSETLDRSITFPWWDRITDAAKLFEWMRSVSAGDAGLFDCDQGWFFKAERSADQLLFLYGDLDTGEVDANVKVGRAAFLRRLDRAETEIRTVVQRLKEQLKIDPWS